MRKHEGKFFVENEDECKKWCDTSRATQGSTPCKGFSFSANETDPERTGVCELLVLDYRGWSILARYINNKVNYLVLSLKPSGARLQHFCLKPDFHNLGFAKFSYYFFLTFFMNSCISNFLSDSDYNDYMENINNTETGISMKQEFKDLNQRKKFP